MLRRAAYSTIKRVGVNRGTSAPKPTATAADDHRLLRLEQADIFAGIAKEGGGGVRPFTVISGRNDTSFVLNGTVEVDGACVLLPRLVLRSATQRPADITRQSFAPILAHAPAISHIIVGVEHDAPGVDHARLLRLLRSATRASIDIMNVSPACATFNFLNEERRLVAALLFPSDR